MEANGVWYEADEQREREYYATLGVKPLREDYLASGCPTGAGWAEKVAVLVTVWTQRFGRDPSVIGKPCISMPTGHHHWVTPPEFRALHRWADRINAPMVTAEARRNGPAQLFGSSKPSDG